MGADPGSSEAGRVGPSVVGRVDPPEASGVGPLESGAAACAAAEATDRDSRAEAICSDNPPRLPPGGAPAPGAAAARGVPAAAGAAPPPSVSSVVTQLGCPEGRPPKLVSDLVGVDR
jgi:hypothetical protein